MPALPDVEIFRQYLDSTSLHQQILKVALLDRSILRKISPDKFRSALKGNLLRKSTRHGKYLFVRLRGNNFIGLHFGMSGSLKYYKDKSEMPAHTRTLLQFRNGYNLAYISVRKLGRVFATDSVETFVESQQLGPDALSIDFDIFLSVFQDRKGTVKSALMNQPAPAGLGNIYTDEILFQAGVRPARKCSQLARKDWETVYHTMRTVLKAVIKRGAQSERFPGSYLTPHRDRREKRPRCGTRLKNKKVGGRTTYYCPSHQT